MPPCHLGERCTGSRARPNTRVQKKKKKLQKLPHIQNAQCRVQGVYEGTDPVRPQTHGAMDGKPQQQTANNGTSTAQPPLRTQHAVNWTVS